MREEIENRVEVVATNVPPGLGEPVFDRLDADIDSEGQATEMRTTGRHDPCVGLRATPIAEAMVALVLIDHALRQRGQNGDVQAPTPRIAARPG